MAVQHFGYFSEVEDRFRLARKSGMFMMSPLDWVLVESWKDAGLPLEAVLAGIDRAFEKYHSRHRSRYSTVNSLAYCAQEVLAAAREMDRAGPPQQTVAGHAAPGQDLASFFDDRAVELARLSSSPGPGAAIFSEAEAFLRDLCHQARQDGLDDLEAVEQRLSALEDRLVAMATICLTDDQMLAIQRDLDSQLAPYRRRLKAEQLATLEIGFKRRKSLEALGLSRLSLFYAG